MLHFEDTIDSFTVRVVAGHSIYVDTCLYDRLTVELQHRRMCFCIGIVLYGTGLHIHMMISVYNVNHYDDTAC